jgi:hypothetical protein
LIDKLTELKEAAWGNKATKISNQIAKKVLALNLEPFPSDHKALKGYPGFYLPESGNSKLY